ncbi:MAG: hypothetical protein WC749_12150 [Dehalococcoidia bacterium]
MNQELFEHIKTFLEKEKHCTNVEYRVPLESKSQSQFSIGTKKIGIPSTKFSQVPIVGGRFYKYHKYPNEINPTEYIGLELHCIVNKSKQTSDGGFIEGIGELFWDKFIMSKIQTWCDRLFLYIMLDEEKGSLERKEFCIAFGFGLIHVQPYNILTEVVCPLNQQGLLSTQAEKSIRIGCEKCRILPTSLTPKDIICPHCSTPSITLTVDPLPLASDTFLQSSTNQKFKGVPNRMPDEGESTPMIKKVFRNWASVKVGWETSGKIPPP